MTLRSSALGCNNVALHLRWQPSRQFLRHQSTGPESHQQSVTEAATKPKSAASQSMGVYRSLSRPFAKVFLGAMLTYQIVYYCWEKMRVDEMKESKLSEVRVLEQKIEEYKDQKTKKSSSWKWF